MSHVNRLDYRINAKATMGRHIELLIDGRPLLEWLENAIPVNAEKTRWSEQRDCQVVLDKLRQTLDRGGDFALLTCAHCQMPEDILLAPFKITHQDDFILWKARPPGAGIYFEEAVFIEFRFHKPQYEKTIQRLPLS